LRKLEAYSQKHFDKEELFQELIGYPDLEKHRNSHQELIADLNEFIRNVSSQESLEEGGINRDQFVDFVRHWLIDHVIKEDLLFKPYVRREHG
jgi:hemerythrin